MPKAGRDKATKTRKEPWLKGGSRMPTNGNGTAGFRGDTEEMTGHVFELPVKGNQYATTLAVLKRYISVTYDSGPAMASLFTKTPSTPTITTPGSAPKATGKTKEGQALVTEFDTEMFKLDCKAYHTKLRELKQDLNTLFAVIIRQCNRTLQAHLFSQATYTEKELAGDCLWLLSEIRTAATRFD